MAITPWWHTMEPWGFVCSNLTLSSLVISDIILPKLDGFELCKEIRKANPHIPVLMLTALGSTDDKLDGFDAGADDYMVKPFDFRELNARIKVLLKKKSRSNCICCCSRETYLQRPSN